MEQRRKIIIPTGSDPDETLSTPHFDTEATLSARPVVPLAEPGSRTPGMAYASAGQGAAYKPRQSVAASSPWKRSTLILIVLAAVSVGVASGLAIGFYQTRTKAPAANVTAQPNASEQQQQATVQPAPEPQQSTRAQQPEAVVAPPAEVQLPDAPAEKATKESATAKKSSDDDAQPDDKQASRSQSRRDEERDAPVIARDRRADDDDVIIRDERDDRRARRERRREERREERRRERGDDAYDPQNIPRPVERVRQSINRIRDIFEGRQP